MQFDTLTVSVEAHIATIRLNRPEKANAMNLAMWHDIRSAFKWVDTTLDARVAILEGEGKSFTSGIESPPSFSSTNRARVSITIASPTTPAAGTTEMSDRS